MNANLALGGIYVTQFVEFNLTRHELSDALIIFRLHAWQTEGHWFKSC